MKQKHNQNNNYKCLYIYRIINLYFHFQLLDLTFFSSLKKEMKKLLWAWQSSPANVGFSINKYSLIGLLYQGTENCLSRPDLIGNGFRRAGIHPWNKAAPDKAKLLPGTLFEAETTIVPETVPLVDLETVNENNVDTGLSNVMTESHLTKGTKATGSE